MRTSSRNELLPVAMVVAVGAAFLVVFAAATAGLWAWLLAGAWILFGIAYAARRLARTQAPPSAEAVPHAHPHADSRYNVLVVAGESSAPDAIRRSVVSSAAGRETSAYVVAPAFSSSLDRLTGDEGAYERASRRLQATLAALEPVSASRDGKVGSHDPVQAVDEGLREFPSDEILLAHHPKGGTSRQTMDVADICRERYEIPVTPVPLDE